MSYPALINMNIFTRMMTNQKNNSKRGKMITWALCKMLLKGIISQKGLK